MRFSVLIASAFAAIATAQSTTESASGTSTKAATSTAPLTPVQSCLNTCKSGDVYCQAACVGVPYPGSVQTNQTTECVANCDQGDGTAAANSAYAACRNKCISSYILTSTLGTADEATATAGGGFAGITSSGSPASSEATPSGSSANSQASGSASGSSSPSGSSGSSSESASGSGSGSSGSAAAAASTGAAVSNLQAAGSVGGVAGLIMAILAL
ncbi:hypothetical protein NA57DRAFT_55380 [Rhizodiscina lignyota]|uniref:Uncharacterized protein n=1 Tax=Rhizodiscina lignyota TaxID=1504668 RepID=A0A9P4ID68_9PEZI|nr:hypothetical protein NA57DRAFT_55380 [Rhizodiscina lignyota]